jgi:cyclic pyranopterin phosphate synthase
MVDVGDKPASLREAVARSRLAMAPATLDLIEQGGAPKGDVLAVARVAGIMAAKRTSELIPLCHALALTAVEVHFAPFREGARAALEITATARTRDRTGVEMEALVAASVAALTVYDMCKSADRGMVVEETFLAEKRGGKSGEFRHPKLAIHDPTV